MMKIIVIGLLYNFLLQASCEPMVKMQLCNDMFIKAIEMSLNQFKLSELKKYIGDYSAESRYGYGPRAKYYVKVIPITSVKFEDLEIMKPTNIKIVITYGEKTLQKNNLKKTENSYLFLTIDILTALHVIVNKGKIGYFMQDCEVYLSDYETDILEDLDMDTAKVRRLLKLKLCSIARQTVVNMNENWKDYLIIDPTGDKNLVIKYISQSVPGCMELRFNLAVRKTELTSAQNHDVLEGNRISFVKDYIATMLPLDVYVKQLNNILEEENVEFSPEQLNRLISGMFETEPTSLKITVTEMKLNVENETMTIKMKLQGFSSKSDEYVLEVIFGENLTVEYLLTNGELKLNLLPSGHEVIYDWKSEIGNSGDLDYEYLKLLITRMNHETIYPAMKDPSLDLSTRVRIPFGSLCSQVVGKLKTVEVLL
ncbi:uncharacterized protein LOC143769022 [Ranitomeya variabilis]|uniref:uncharacterized protein LOC143769022 n=1 Tax=Ranitomeya variabilis TaxID=490064 RepID=UPI00405758D1